MATTASLRASLAAALDAAEAAVRAATASRDAARAALAALDAPAAAPVVAPVVAPVAAPAPAPAAIGAPRAIEATYRRIGEDERGRPIWGLRLAPGLAVAVGPGDAVVGVRADGSREERLLGALHSEDRYGVTYEIAPAGRRRATPAGGTPAVAPPVDEIDLF